MIPKQLVVCLVWTVAFGAPAAILAATQSAPASSTTRTPESVQADYQQAVDAIRSGRFQEGTDGMVRLVESGDYRSLSATDQGRALPFAAREIARTDPAKAYELFALAVALPQPELISLDGHASLAAFLEHDAEAMDSLLKLRQRASGYWTTRHDDMLYRLVRRFRSASDTASEYELLNRLYSIGYKTLTDGEPNGLWLRFVELLLDSGEKGRAAIVAGKITSPATLARMRIDKRFDPIVEVNPALLDIPEAIRLQVERTRVAATAFPRSLDARSDHLTALYDARQYAAAVEFADQVIEQAALAGDRPAFDDADEINWIWDHKARSLVMLHRYDEAEQAWATGRTFPERKSKNVSQTINLATMYSDLERYDEAIATLESVGAASTYGKIQIETVRLRAAIRRGDAAAVEKSLAFIRENRADAPLDYIESSLLAGKQADAASYLIEVLDRQATRGMALGRVQRYADVDNQPPGLVRIDKALRTLIDRPEVAAAISKWGRIEDIPLPPGLR